MPQKILVVDDDLFIRELYDEILGNEGYDVELAENGEMALDKLKNDKYDLLLLDVVMPGIDGIEVLEALSDTPPLNPDMSIILLSNLENDPKLKDADKKGVVQALIKANLTPDQILKVVRKTIN